MTMKNYKKTFIHTSLLLLIGIIFISCSLQTSFATNETIDKNNVTGINGGIVATEVNGILTLESETYNKQNIDYGILINKNITIQGNGPTNTVIIDAENKSRIFTIENNINVKFINITFMNGRAGNGGAIFNNFADTTMTFINCSFINNVATSSDGGAIHNDGANFSVKNSTFTGNHANNNGGVIYNTGIYFSVSNATFTGNFANNNGGVIYNSGVYGFNVRNSNFINNSVTRQGGTIYNSGSNFTLKSSTFTDSSGDEGGTIYNGGANLIVDNSTFINSTSVRGGGAIFNQGINFNLNNSAFNICHSSTDGGAIWNSVNSFIINNSNFTNNTASVDGGAIRIFYTPSNFIVENSSFINNSATNGGVIYSNGHIFNVSNSTFINNSATNNGGVIYNNGGNSFSLVNSTFEGNNATTSGGVIYNTGVNFIVDNSTFIDNNATGTATTNGGGAIYNGASTMIVLRSNFTSNNASQGGAIFDAGYNMNISACNFIDNIATSGVAFYMSGGNVNFNYNRLVNNSDSVNMQIYVAGGSINASSNWWGDNENPLANYIYKVISANLILDNYYTMIFNSSDTIAKIVGDNLATDYYFVINDTNDNSGTGLIPYFDTIIYFNGNEINITDARQSQNINILLTAAGFNINITAGTDNQVESIILDVAKANTNSTIVVSPVNSKIGDSVSISGQLANYIGVTQVYVSVDGNIQFVNVNDTGTWTLNYVTNRVDSIVVEVSLTGDGNYNDFFNSSNFTVLKSTNNSTNGTKIAPKPVSKVVTTLVIAKIKALFNKSNTLKVTFSDKNGKLLANKAVSIIINNKVVATVRTNSVGVASFKYTFKTRNPHNILAKFSGDTTHAASNSKLLPLTPKDKTTINLAKFQAKFKKKATFKVTLKNHKKKAMAKKVVKFYANGKLLGKAKTNAKGIATLKKKVPVKGTVSFVAIYSGDKTYHDSSSTRKMKVK